MKAVVVMCGVCGAICGGLFAVGAFGKMGNSNRNKSMEVREQEQEASEGKK